MSKKTRAEWFKGSGFKAPKMSDDRKGRIITEEQFQTETADLKKGKKPAE